MWKLVVVFRSYRLIRPLFQSGPNVVSRHQIAKLENLLKFHGFIEGNL